MDMNESFGDRLKRYRTSSKMTQQEFAKRLGVTGAAVSTYENGTRYPSLDILVKISKIFGITVDELLDGQKREVLLDVTRLSLDQMRVLQDLIRMFEEYNAMKSVVTDSKKLIDKVNTILDR